MPLIKTYIRVNDQGKWGECPLQEVRSIKIVNDGVYNQMEITLENGSRHYADEIVMFEKSMFKGDSNGS